MKLYKYLISGGLALTLSLSSCESWLEVEPNDTRTTDYFYSTPSEMEQAIIGIYNGLLPISDYSWLMSEVRSDNASQTPEELVIPVQTHETNCLLIGDAYLSASSQQRQEMLHGVDALITREPGYCLCISTADCVPVLVYDKKHGAIAAIHAGWRGTVAYIVRDTLLRMEKEFGTSGEDVVACIGPSISLASFEVGEEVYEAFQKNGFDMPRISIRKEETGKHHIDLWEANRMQILAFGVPSEQVELARICTYIHHDEFFSARRLGIKSGRILSGIMIHK